MYINTNSCVTRPPSLFLPPVLTPCTFFTAVFLLGLARTLHKLVLMSMATPGSRVIAEELTPEVRLYKVIRPYKALYKVKTPPQIPIFYHRF